MGQLRGTLFNLCPLTSLETAMLRARPWPRAFWRRFRGKSPAFIVQSERCLTLSKNGRALRCLEMQAEISLADKQPLIVSRNHLNIPIKSKLIFGSLFLFGLVC